MSNNAKSVRREKLEGFRRPTESEAKIMKAYALPKLQMWKKCHSTLVWILLSFGLIFCFFVRPSYIPCTGPLAGIMLISLSWVSAWGIHEGENILNKVMQDRFEVLDVDIVAVDMSSGKMGYTTAYIAAKDGTRCSDRFRIPESTAKKFLYSTETGKGTIPAKLLKCMYGNGGCGICGYFDLFPEELIQMTAISAGIEK